MRSLRPAGLGLPLRVRVMLTFGLGSMVISSLVAVLTWRLSSGYMLEQRQSSAVRQATVDARLVETTLRSGSAGLAQLLTGLGAEVESAVLLVDRGQWMSSGNLIDPTRLPKGLLTMVGNGQAARQRIVLNRTPVLAVGLPLPTVQATYVEIFPLRELDRNFHFLSWMLFIGVLASGVGAALVGWWSTTRAFRPLARLTSAAATAASGDLSVRMPQTRDPDLAPLAAAFNRTVERLQQRVDSDARFAGEVSHELRSPLTTMVNAMAVLQRRRGELTGHAREALDLLATDLTRFRHMVDDLLEISLAHEDATAIQLEPVDLGEFLTQSAHHSAHAATASVEASEPAPVVLADRRRLERAVTNLVANAEQHGGGLVRLAVVRRNGNARIEVDDAGTGVSDSDRTRIFERFARGSPASRDPTDTGAGLGLALVAQHVRHHGGRTWVEDRPGGGARFVIEIPEAAAQ